MGNTVQARFVKLQGKISIEEFNFIIVVSQKFDTLINMELFLNVFWNHWKGLQHELKGNSKIKVYGLYFWECHLSFPMNLGGKSNIRYLKFSNESGWKIKHKVPYWGKFRWVKVMNFSWNFVTFSRWEFSPTKIVPNEKFSQWKTVTGELIFLSGN